MGTMEQLLHYQVEQKHIFGNIKLQINQNVELSNILQIAIDRVRTVLNIDRLVIYQLGIPSQSFCRSFPQDPLARQEKLTNRVTFEAKSSELGESILDYQGKRCRDEAESCWSRYRQGFTLAINDIERSNLSSPLYDLMVRLQVKSKVVAPINLKDRLWGVLVAHQCQETRTWSHHETKFLQQTAEYLAIAVHQAQSYEELQRQKKSLEKQVKNQAQQIENALVAARVASQTKHEFIGNISHELKTPLTRVIGLSGTLLHWSIEEGRIPLPIEKQQQYLKTIHDSGRHLLKLINTILEFSEVQSGSNLLNAKKISLHKLCLEIVQSLHPQAEEAEIALALDIRLEPEAELFYGDREKLREILLNLLDNALKFTDKNGKVFLRVWQENKKVVFEVEDTGVGISSEKLPLLFETFSPLENFRQRIHDGVGIGLALTKHLVELHGGSIEVESTPDKGSSFRVCLPVSPADNSPISNDIPLKNSSNELKKVVLITQDDETAVLICNTLTAANYQVVWLIDALTAINQLDFLEPQLIILDRDNLDIEIPDVTDTIKTIELIEETKIILMYSDQLASENENFVTDNIDDQLLKSADLPRLLNKIEALI